MSYGKRLKGFLVSVISFGIEVALDIVGEAAAPKLTPLINKLEANATIPPELAPILDEIKNPKGEIGAILAQSAGGAIVGGALGSVMDALFLRFSYDVNKALHPRILNEQQLVALWNRNFIKADALDPELRKLGLDDDAILGLKDLSKIRLDANTVIELARRNPETYNPFWKDLTDAGWDEPRLKAIQELVWRMPNPQDLILWLAREALEDDMAQKYGLDDEFGGVETKLFEQIGLKPEFARNHWRAHWQHPSFNQMIELLHRGLLTPDRSAPGTPDSPEAWASRDAIGEEEIYEWYRLTEIPPHWRAKLTRALWNVPTRVDVRRWLDMRTIGEDELYSVYHRMGYHGRDLDNYVLWTKIYNEAPLLLNRFRNGWINENDVRNKLAELGLPDERITEFLQEKIKPEKPERVQKERDLTKAEIIKGIKTEVITPEDGYARIQDMGYDALEAEEIILINVEALRGSPETHYAFVKLTQTYRRSQGLPHKIPSNELLATELELKNTEQELKQAELDKELPSTIDNLRGRKDQLAYRYSQLSASFEQQKEEGG